ncbi:MAG: SPOR domain-containing protein [Ignavibacteriaceae bacterium]|jgi:tetratricopeptide (TPR) repeat protein|nr:SPOR domain-containing protein [Ignavibacteriaceae bacterium]
MKKNISVFLIIFFLLLPSASFAQEVDIIPYLKKVEQGSIEEVKLELLNLKVDYPKSANLIFLEAVLTENGQDAVTLYQKIIDNYPKSRYADASLYRIYSYYFALGLYNTADKQLDRLKKEYPESPYIKMADINIVKKDDEETNSQTGEIKQQNTSGQEFTYTIQAGAFTNSANASGLKKEIENAGMISFIKEKNIAGTDFNVVYIGKFTSRKEAEDFLPIVNTRFKLNGRVTEINQ